MFWRLLQAFQKNLPISIFEAGVNIFNYFTHLTLGKKINWLILYFKDIIIWGEGVIGHERKK